MMASVPGQNNRPDRETNVGSHAPRSRYSAVPPVSSPFQTLTISQHSSRPAHNRALQVKTRSMVMRASRESVLTSSRICSPVPNCLQCHLTPRREFHILLHMHCTGQSCIHRSPLRLSSYSSVSKPGFPQRGGLLGIDYSFPHS